MYGIAHSIDTLKTSLNNINTAESRCMYIYTHTSAHSYKHKHNKVYEHNPGVMLPKAQVSCTFE